MRHTRYQGAIIKDDQMLLIRVTERRITNEYFFYFDSSYANTML